MERSNTPVFYDEKRLRWRHSRRTFFVLSVFFVTIFLVTLGSIMLKPVVLPQVNPAVATKQSRGVSNVPKDSSSLQAATSYQVPNLKNVAVNNAPGRIVTFYVNWDENSFTSLKANIGKIDELMPEWLHLGDGSGNLAVDDQERQNQTLDFIKQNRPNLPIAVLVNNYNQNTQNWDSAALSRMLEDPNARTLTIQNILANVRQNGFSGVNIDFESVPQKDQQNLAAFMKELYGTFHPLGLEVSQSVPLDDDSFDYKTLAQSNDFLVLMAYDENSLNDTLAGPIASQDWFASKVDKQIKNLGTEKVVVAIGGYGYDWLDQQKVGTELNYQDVVRKAKESNSKIYVDAKSLNPTFDYYDGDNQLHHVWFLDATTIFNEMLIGQKLGGPKGYALWMLGSEDPGTWQVFANRTSLNEQTAQTLSKMDYSNDVSYEGEGEIFRVTAEPQQGTRVINFDKATGFITNEDIQTYPSSYVITRWGANQDKKIALTFDDGPDPEYTPQILDILKKYNVPATFFVIGSNANANQGLLERIVNEGNEVGNHTYSHPNVSLLSAQQVKFELSATERLFEGVLGRKSLLFRPPYSEDIEPENSQQVVPLVETTGLGYYTIGMHIDPNDWARPGVDAIVGSVLDGANNRDGNIVLLHDAGGDRSQTIEALPKIIEGLRAQGYQFVTASQLMGLESNDVMPQISVREQFIAKVNGTAFTALSYFNRFIYGMFIIGIILGSARFLFIMTLAIAQWFRSHKGKYMEFSKGHFPSVDVIIPGYNEEKVIVKTVKTILGSTYQNIHIYVVDDGSKDNTLQILQKEFSGNPKITIFSKENGGKSLALNYGIERSAGEIIVTLDADTQFSSNTIEKLIRRFADRRIAAVAGNAKVGNRINILTRWQALEYITSQNLDRRAFELMNCISVVPGAIGAWRRDAILEAGGFSDDTLAEDADLTYAILKNGHQIAYDDEAIAYTEAPDTVKDFVKQRFRWMYGTLQTVWKHRKVIGKFRYGGLEIFTIPNVIVFQIFFPLVSPLMDLTLVIAIIGAVLKKYNNQIDFSQIATIEHILFYYILFIVIDLVTSLVPFILERKEQKSLILWMPLQRFFYRQLMYYVAIKAVVTAIKGTLVGWGKLERKATVEQPVE
jgi:cellulose synthase/poly-beta-1,6-N-acetylglucosamine synthase-like glycosyltransferase/peptidoglycan/xylan/chitin deacetylase (PgdA/CDA1 family)/spore germination protein YaaH